MLALLKDLAHYNAWMNKNLYAHLGDMPDDQRKADEGLFFRSIHGTLNHLLLVDQLWLGRMTGEPFQVDSLDQELYSDFAQLRLQQKKVDKHILSFVNGLEDKALERAVSYTALADGQPRNFPLHQALSHLFNHQTHHRGQITAVMSRHGLDYGVTDLIYLVGKK